MAYIDAIIHIPNMPALIAGLAAISPGNVQDGALVGFNHHTHRSGDAALVYVRMRPEQAAVFRHTPGVTILAEAPYAGPGTEDVVYAALQADPAAMAIYDTAWPRNPVEVQGPDGKAVQVTPDLRFGYLG